MNTSGIGERERALLLKPFPFKQHEWNQKGYVYVQERAINARLAQVDPAFRYEILKYEHRGIQASCHARLTICGVSRDAIGMQAVEMTKDGKREAGEPEKGADTDAFKRCARKHGVGLYLLDSPGEQAFEGWLTQQMTAWERAYGELLASPAAEYDMRPLLAVAQEYGAEIRVLPPPATALAAPTVIKRPDWLNDTDRRDKLLAYAKDAFSLSEQDVWNALMTAYGEFPYTPVQARAAIITAGLKYDEQRVNEYCNDVGAEEPTRLAIGHIFATHRALEEAAQY